MPASIRRSVSLRNTTGRGSEHPKHKAATAQPDSVFSPISDNIRRRMNDTLTNTPHPAGAIADLPRRIGFWGAIAIMIGVTIGTGIFRSPVSVAREVGTPAAALILWTAGGVLSLLGAFTFAEMATRFPHSGGMYVFLREGFGPIVAFIFGWTYLLLSKPSAAAAIALVFATHFNALFSGTETPPTLVSTQITTCAVLIALTLLNTFHVRLGTGFAIFVTSLKVGSLLLVVAAALFIGGGNASNFSFADAPKPLWLALAPAMAAVLWTYDGWNDVGSVAGEIRNPRTTLPRVFFWGTFSITLIYVAVNLVYLWVVRLDEMRGLETVAPVAMGRMLGPAGERIVTAMILISTLGATHGAIITGARVTFAQARDGLLFRVLAHTHRRYETPDVSLWTQCAIACLATYWLETFEALAEAFVFTIWIFYGMAGAAIFVMRGKAAPRHSESEPIFLCPGYPWVPALFVLCALVMTVLLIIEAPFVRLGMLAVLLAGVPVYFIWRRFFPPRATADVPGHGA